MPDLKKNSKDTAKSGKSAGKPKASKGRMAAAGRYFAETKAELKKIVWPTPAKVVNNTAIVIFAIFAIGIFIWIVDFISSGGLNALLEAFS